MIGKIWMKAFAFAGASAVAVAAMPAVSEAHAHYTGKTPAGIAMMASTDVTPPVTTVLAKHRHKKHKHITTASSKHRSHKLLKKTGLKKKTV